MPNIIMAWKQFNHGNITNTQYPVFTTFTSMWKILQIVKSNILNVAESFCAQKGTNIGNISMQFIVGSCWNLCVI